MSQLPVIVLGMHKSGTSLVAEVLHRSGITMVDQESSAGYDEGNHFERAGAREINKRLLGSAGRSSLKTYATLDLNNISPELYRTAKELLMQTSRVEGNWGFKDPRTCLTHAFWNEVMPDHRLICVYRDAGEVHEHYTRRVPFDLSRGYRALRAWHAYNTQMLAAFEKTVEERRILLSYSQLMDDPRELDRLSDFLQTPLVDARVANLRRGKSANTIRLRVDRHLLKMRTGRDVGELTNRLDRRLLETLSMRHDA